jgi:release factor glutamine methyltransferase
VRIRDSLLEAAERLQENHISNPRLTAEILMAYCLSASREYLFSHDDRQLTATERAAFEGTIRKRISGVPVQYITGVQEFYGRVFKVSPAVLIPRPETEHVIDAVLEADARAGSRIVDVGTGSGCIAITLAIEIPGAHVFAGDISEAALRVAQRNAVDLETGVRFICMDMLDALEGEFDFVVSNPPYVPPGDLSNLQREVRECEPHIALFSPEDQYGIYRRLIPSAHERLKRGGHLIMEIGFGMEETIVDILGPNWHKLPTKTDLQGIPRTIIAQKKN